MVTQFIAYVYGGWNRDSWRPEIDEWQLFDNFTPYFPGHAAPYRPISGTYDDSVAATASAQVTLAAAHGISAFTYFLYTDENGFVMDRPARLAFDAAEGHGSFSVGLTWCLRLPHHQLPIPSSFTLYRSRGTLTTVASSRVLEVDVGSILADFGPGADDDRRQAGAILRLGGRRRLSVD